MYTIAIDGACRRNGQPDCLAVGAAFITLTSEDKTVQTYVVTRFEENSTSQRGELLGLLAALEWLEPFDNDAQIITDSEYIFNTLDKDWCDRWEANGWLTAEDMPVKNKDLWQKIWRMYTNGMNITWHIKGHLLSVGNKKAKQLLMYDTSGYELYKEVLSKEISPDKLEHAIALCIKNNQFDPTEYHQLQKWAAVNACADAIAGYTIDTHEVTAWTEKLDVLTAGNAL